MSDLERPSRRPWDRRPGETRQSYEAFRAYLEMGHDRSILAVAHKLRKTRQIVGRWSSEHDWVDRCAANDTHLGAVEMKSREKVRAEMAEKWERRRQETVEKDWSKHLALSGKIGKMIDMMLDPEKPMAPTAANINKLLRLVEADRRLAAGIFAEAKAQDADDFDPTTATPDELRAYLASKGVKTEGVS